MNTATDSPCSPDLESLHQAVQGFQPNPRRIPFHHLKPFHDFIVELRGKNASYFIIAEMLQQHGVKTSRARVAEYGRVVLNGGKRRKRRKYTHQTQVSTQLGSPPVALADAAKNVPASVSANFSDSPSPQNSPSSHKRRGPRIANVELVPQAEWEIIQANLKTKQNS